LPKQGELKVNAVVGWVTTVICSVSVDWQGGWPMEYVMVWVPTPATEGLNAPFADMPGPDHVPPLLTAVIVMAAVELRHIGGFGLMVAIGGPVCAPLGGGPNCSVNVLLELLQSCATTITCEPAIT
jgi:hypothetical protein